MKTITYPVRLIEADYERVVKEANRRRKSVAELFRDLVTYGLPALPEIPDYEAAQAAWDSLGPPPEVYYDELPENWRRGFGRSRHEGKGQALRGGISRAGQPKRPGRSRAGECEVAFPKPRWLRDTCVINMAGLLGVEFVKIEGRLGSLSSDTIEAVKGVFIKMFDLEKPPVQPSAT